MRIRSVLSRRGVAAVTTPVVVTASAVAVIVAGGAPASANPGPVQQRTSTAVTADALPTVQIDGIVWSQALVGNIDYAGGSFAHSRPAGQSVGGPGEIVANNLISFDVTTGVRTSWAPNLNGQILAVAASPDGSTIYVGGDFTIADGQTRNHIAAYSTSTGQLLPNFHPSIGGQVRAIAFSPDGTIVYAGGNFGSVGGVTRSRLASFLASNGALQAWAPTADNNRVNALAVSPDGSKVIIGGAMTTVNGVADGGLVAVSSTDGSIQPYPVANLIHDSYSGTATDGTGAAILSLTLSSDKSMLIGTGYSFKGGGNLEGTFTADPNTGNLHWIEDCHGDSYGATETNGLVYVVSHEHFCANMGAFPDTNPRSAWYRTTAFTDQVTGTVAHDTEAAYYDWGGTPAPSQINWYPYLATGNASGAQQAAWSAVSNSQYVIEGGEFPSVNQTAQQGLVRFTIPSNAPNLQGPRISASSWSPTVTALSPTVARIAIAGNYDRDDQNLTYTFQRSGTTISTQTVVSHFWDEPTVSFIDTGLTPGSTYQYRVRVADPNGNSVTTAYVSYTMPTSGGVNAYVNDVLTDGARSYWRLDETSGPTNADTAGFNPLTDSSSGITLGQPGAIIGDTDTAATFNGTTGTTGTTVSTAAPDTFSAEVWFKTTAKGGKILGFGDVGTGASTFYDRNLYLDASGHLYFGVNPGAVTTINSGQSYNDGNWHYAVAELSSAGMALYVDGLKVAGNTSVTTGETMDGYWRVGGDTLSSAVWPNVSNKYFNGTLDEPAIYPVALTATQIRQHYVDSGRTFNVPSAPSDNYGSVVFNDNPALYWRLDDAAGPTIADAGMNNITGVAAGGLKYGIASPVTTLNRAVTFNGTTGTIGSKITFVNPSTYSEEAWFKTTTTNGGRIIGFGNKQASASTTYDRMIYMTNAGTLMFGVNNGAMTTISSAAAYNDGNWHHVVATQAADGINLYVDGALVGSNSTATSALNFVGNWRVGGDALAGWPNNPTSGYFAGTIDEAAVYLSELSPAQVLAHFKASPAAPNQLPTSSFTATVSKLSVAFNASASFDPDGTVQGYAWNFGDGTTGTGVSPTHAYAAAGPYTVTLTVTDNQNGTGSSSQTVTTVANQLPTGSFTATVAKEHVTFDATASSDSDGTIASYAWDFGDGTTGTGVTTSHDYTAAGPFTVTLTLTDNDGGTSQTAETVTTVANALPTASYTFSCTYLVCSFDGTGSTDSDGTVTGWSWDFADGSTGSGSTPSHTFPGTGTYNVVLTATDNDGGTNTSTQTVSVTAKPNDPPTASFQTTVVNLTASFDATASADDDGTVASYAWDFGDGTTGTGVKPSHTYAASGTFTVVLTVTDNQGATGTASNPVVLNPVTVIAQDTFNRTVSNGFGNADLGGAWTVSSTASKYNVTPGAGTVSLAAAASTSGYLNAAPVQDSDSVLDFSLDKATAGSGTYVWLAARHQSSKNEYRLRVKITNTNAMSLSLSKTTGTSEAIITTVNLTGTPFVAGTKYRIRFDVSGTSAVSLQGKLWLASASEPSAWQITATDSSSTIPAGVPGFLAVTGSGEANAPLTLSLGNLNVVSLSPPNRSPNASFTSSCNNLVCSFNGSASNDPDGSIVSYAWTFGDGATGTGATPSHTYSGTGTDSVTLTVTDNQGAIGRQTGTVSPTAPAVNQNPIASFTSSCTNLACSFDGTASYDPDGSVASWAWDFGDGVTATGSTASHTYAAAGPYTVTLTVTDTQGATGSTTNQVSPTAPPPNQPPNASFTSSCTNLACTFNGAGSNDPDGTVAAYAWNYGDGTLDTGVAPSHTFAAAGPYTVTLTVTDNQGATGTTSNTVTVTAPPPPAAQDTFNRTVSNGLGTADIGGAWTLAGSASKFNVTPGTGTASLVAGSSVAGYLNSVAVGNTDEVMDFSLDKPTAGSGTYVYLIGRHQASKADYELRVKITSNNALSLSLLKSNGTTPTTLATANLTGITFTAGTRYRLRFDLSGTASVALQGKLWVASGTEPAAWQVTSTDASSPLGNGAPGFLASTSTGEANSPITLSLYGLTEQLM